MNSFFHACLQNFYMKIFVLQRQWCMFGLFPISENEDVFLGYSSLHYLQPPFSSSLPKSTRFLSFFFPFSYYVTKTLVIITNSLIIHIFFVALHMCFNPQNANFTQSWPPWQRAQRLGFPQRLKCPFCPRFLHCTWTWYA